MSNSTKTYSCKQEALIAKSLGWFTVVASGARINHPGDVKSNEWLGECKTHVKFQDKIIFKSSVWKKLLDEAVSCFKHPVYFVDNGTQSLEHTWCLFIANMDIGDIDVKKFPNNIQENIIFSDSQLPHGLYSIRFNNQFLYISDFDTFRRLVVL